MKFLIIGDSYGLGEWTWNRRGKDKILEQNNINKLIATKKAGYDVKLIREGKEIDYAIIAR
jgi:hypothetical protein